MAKFEGFKCDRCTRPTEGTPTVVQAGAERHELCSACSELVTKVLDGWDPDDDDP